MRERLEFYGPGSHSCFICGIRNEFAELVRKARNARTVLLPKYTYKNNRLRKEYLHLKKEKERREIEQLEALLKLERSMPEFLIVQTL